MSIPIASYGNNAQVAEDLIAKLLPEFESESSHPYTH